MRRVIPDRSLSLLISKFQQQIDVAAAARIAVGWWVVQLGTTDCCGFTGERLTANLTAKRVDHPVSSFDDKPGEFGYAIHGEEYGFDRLSFELTETHRAARDTLRQIVTVDEFHYESRHAPPSSRP
jgi:hypothetical protein